MLQPRKRCSLIGERGRQGKASIPTPAAALGNLKSVRLRRSDARSPCPSPAIFPRPRHGRAAGAGRALGRLRQYQRHSMSLAFADPARYDLYECKQLEPERKNLATRAAELQGLMAKAETGAGGAVVAELAYRNDLYRGARPAAACRRGLAAQQMPRNRASAPAPVTPPPAARVAPSLAVGQFGLLTHGFRTGRIQGPALDPPVVNPVLPRQHPLRAQRPDDKVARSGRRARVM